MIDTAVQPTDQDDVEASLRASLVQGDAAFGAVLPVLRHLVTAADGSVFNDEILARVRGLLASLAGRLLDLLPEPAAAGTAARLGRMLADNPALLSHAHAAALEWQLSERLQLRLASDPVLTPRLQALIAGNDAELQGLAMACLAAQASWSQAQQRMKWDWRELPAELLHDGLLAMRSVLSDQVRGMDSAEQQVRDRYDEGANRLGLLARLCSIAREEPATALSITHSGLSLFVSALAITTGQARDAVLFAMHEPGLSRIALMLRSAGCAPEAIAAQIEAIEPAAELPRGLERIGPDLAASILHGADPAGATAP